MFCPEGYVIFKKVDAILRGWVWQSASRRSHQPATDADEEQLRAFEQFHKEQIERWMLLRDTFFWTCPTLSIASPQGTVLRVSPDICAPVITFDQEFDRKDPYWFLSEESWTVRARRTRERAEAAKLQIQDQPDYDDEQRADWLDKDDGQVSEPFPDENFFRQRYDLGMLATRASFAEIFERFEGWALCIAESDLPSDPSVFGVVIPDEVGSASLDEQHVQAIVAEIVEEFDKGNPVVRDHAKQRWAPGMKHEQWLSVWRMVTSLRPKLSRPGPKRSSSRQI